MAKCGHCDKQVKGIRDHIRASHGDPYYEMGPDFRYYGYRWLKERDMVSANPAWDSMDESVLPKFLR